LSEIEIYVDEVLKRAAVAARGIARASTAQKDRFLIAAAEALVARAAEIQAANGEDIRAAEEAGVSPAMVDRLRLTDKRLEQMADGLRAIAGLRDPVGEVIGGWTRPNGLRIHKVRVPLGVIAMIYEARPNVTADAAALCIKSGNAVILRGGKEALAVARKAKVPVIKHYKGVCHTYVDAEADLDVAERVCLNAKLERPSVCNAMETLLVHEAVAAKFLPRIVRSLREGNCELRGCERSRRQVPDMTAATEEDWEAEYNDLVLSVRVVPSLDAAVAHIARYGSHHSDAIVTRDLVAAERFTSEVDSCAVFVNCSTRFNDGGEFGMGAEIGISTDRLHARGPMALPELTTYKYVVWGAGQIRE